MPHICVSESGESGSDNGLSPIWHQSITSTNAGLLSIQTSGTNSSEIRIKVQNISFMKMCLKMSSAKMAAILSGGDELYVQDKHVDQLLAIIPSF